MLSSLVPRACLSGLALGQKTTADCGAQLIQRSDRAREVGCSSQCACEKGGWVEQEWLQCKFSQTR